MHRQTGNISTADPAGPVTPNPNPCVRIRTNQRGPTATLYENPLANGRYWTSNDGASATGKHESYVYTPTGSIGEAGAIYQQYLVLSNVQGVFPDDDTLWIGLNPFQQDQTLGPLKTADSSLGGADQTSVNCDTGGPLPTPPDQPMWDGGGAQSPNNDIPISNGGGGIWVMAITTDETGGLLTRPEPVTGQVSGATGIFHGFGDSSGQLGDFEIRIYDIVEGPTGLCFINGEDVDFDDVVKTITLQDDHMIERYTG